MSYFISSKHEDGWGIDATEFIAALRRFGALEIVEVDDEGSNHQLEWRTGDGDDRVDASLDRMGQAIHLAGAIERCAAFAIWFRRQVDDAQTLLFYDEAFSSDITLTASTQTRDIVDLFSA